MIDRLHRYRPIGKQHNSARACGRAKPPIWWPESKRKEKEGHSPLQRHPSSDLKTIPMPHLPKSTTMETTPFTHVPLEDTQDLDYNLWIKRPVYTEISGPCPHYSPLPPEMHRGHTCTGGWWTRHTISCWLILNPQAKAHTAKGLWFPFHWSPLKTFCLFHDVFMLLKILLRSWGKKNRKKKMAAPIPITQN